MQTTFILALNIVLKLNFLNTIFFMNFTGQILLKTKKDNSISRNILYSRVVTLMSFLEMHSNSSKKPWWCLNRNLLMNCLFWGVQIDGFARHWKCVLSNQWPHYSISSVRWKTLMLHSLMKGTLGHWCNIITRTMRMKELINETVDWIIDYVLKHLT